MESDKRIIEQYISRLIQILQDLPRDQVKKTIAIIREARQKRRMFFLFGNGVVRPLLIPF